MIGHSPRPKEFSLISIRAVRAETLRWLLDGSSWNKRKSFLPRFQKQTSYSFLKDTWPIAKSRSAKRANLIQKRPCPKSGIDQHVHGEIREANDMQIFLGGRRFHMLSKMFEQLCKGSISKIFNHDATKCTLVMVKMPKKSWSDQYFSNTNVNLKTCLSETFHPKAENIPSHNHLDHLMCTCFLQTKKTKQNVLLGPRFFCSREPTQSGAKQ